MCWYGYSNLYPSSCCGGYSPYYGYGGGYGSNYGYSSYNINGGFNYPGIY